MVTKSFVDSPVINASKYIDFFGFSDKGSIKNVDINKMLDMIERLYDNDAMPDITQVMIWWHECTACEKSMPYWIKMTKALSMRLRKYTFMTVEMNQVVEIGGYKVSGNFLLKKYGGKGVPAFLQDFEVKTIIKKRGETRELKEIMKREFYIVIEGQLQPFMFLAKTFDVENLNIYT